MGFGSTVRNNIFFSAPKSRCFNSGSKVQVPSTLVVVDSNGYYQPNPSDVIAQVGTRIFTAAQMAEYRKLTGWDQHSLIADPLFADLAGGDFHLKPGSPCAGMGSQARLSPE